MTLLKIALMGHPVLRRRADPVADPTAPEIARLAEDMVETMIDAQGVGLAAPQIYRSQRIIVFRVPQERVAEGEPQPPPGIVTLANPEIEPLDDRLDYGVEGCLSIPGIRGIVPRFHRIRYRGLALDGSTLVAEAAGFHARVVQHEVDHLDGIVYLQRMDDLTRLAFEAEAHHLGREPSTPLE